MNILTIEEVARQLKISIASVKNWEKQGYIAMLHEGRYLESDVKNLAYKLDSGEIKRLNSRANKSRSKNKFIPVEYISKENSIIKLEIITEFITGYNIKPEQALFLLSVNLLVKLGEISKEHLYEALKFNNSSLIKRDSVFSELKNWFSDISSGEIRYDNLYCRFLLECELPEERDSLGIVYQSIIHEGKKSSLGSYYTPASLVNNMIKDNIKGNGKVLDPCCGTGQFLLSMADHISDPTRIWGADIDTIATRITKINLLIHYIHIDFIPNIFNINSLKDWSESGFSLLATNPPWGAKINKRDLKGIKDNYTQIDSAESFSFFISFALKYLERGGVYSFVLPESFLYVKNHQDIRSYMINNSTIKYIESVGRLFKNVFSSVIRIDGVNEICSNGTEVRIKQTDDCYNISQNRFLVNVHNIIDIYCSEEDQKIVDIVYKYPHTDLKNRAKWALGIVTGNNSLHLKKEQAKGLEAIYKGKELRPLKLGEASNYIAYNPKSFQQCAPDNLYRAPEKLLYKFISRDLVFSYDNRQLLSLNSANILIPLIDGLPVKVVGSLLNSAVYRFIFRKKFNALKILKGDIESLPIPIFENKEIDYILSITDEFIDGTINFSTIDNYFFEFFKINQEDRRKILEFLES